MTNTPWNGEHVIHMHNNRALSVVINFKEAYNLSHTHANYEAAIEAIRNRDLDALRAACAPINMVKNTEVFRSGGITIENNQVLRNGKPIQSVLTDRILEFVENGFPYQPLVQFMDRLYRNPSKTAVDELFLFLSSGVTPAPIMEDGRFIAYKKVRDDYKDIYTGTVSYELGEVVEMERFEVDEDRNNTCSSGLHFCSMSYLRSFGVNDPGKTRIVIVAIDPADVVAIPSDYNNAKGRAWRMEVIGELSEEQYRAAIAGTHAFSGSYLDTSNGEDNGFISANVATAPTIEVVIPEGNLDHGTWVLTVWPTRETARAASQEGEGLFIDWQNTDTARARSYRGRLTRALRKTLTETNRALTSRQRWLTVAKAPTVLATESAQIGRAHV